MNPDAKKCFEMASTLLQQVTGCQRSVADLIVEQIAMGVVHWHPGQPWHQSQRNLELFKAWSAGFDAHAAHQETVEKAAQEEQEVAAK